MNAEGTCPCVDGLPDPCTLCGAPADGVCGVNDFILMRARAEKAEAECSRLRGAAESALDKLTSGKHFDAEDTLERALVT